MTTVTPRGFRRAAEWEPHEATWLGWPENTSDWPGRFAPIPWVYTEIVKKIVAGEEVRILLRDRARRVAAERALRRAGVDLGNVQFFYFRTDRGWTRDSGPMFVSCESCDQGVAILNFRFNGWAKYPDWKNDVKTHVRAAKAIGVPLCSPTHNDVAVVLEGGAIDTNGMGSLLTTEECLLDQRVQVRNPGFGREDMEEVFKTWLGATNVVWLGKGIAGDDTHGHVDDLCRFVNGHTVVLCSETNERDPNYGTLRENKERLLAARLENGSRPVVVDLPMPTPLFFEGMRLPASYANFYIANAAVLVPTFNDPKDRIALGILSELIPDRPVIGIHAVDLVWGLGTLHCLTHEQPMGKNTKARSME